MSGFFLGFSTCLIWSEIQRFFGVFLDMFISLYLFLCIIQLNVSRVSKWITICLFINAPCPSNTVIFFSWNMLLSCMIKWPYFIRTEECKDVAVDGRLHPENVYFIYVGRLHSFAFRVFTFPFPLRSGTLISQERTLTLQTVLALTWTPLSHFSISPTHH